jgi:hypothetical protein
MCALLVGGLRTAVSFWRFLQNHDWDDDPLAEPLVTIGSFGVPSR